MNKFSTGVFSGTKTLIPKNNPKKVINILRKMYKKEIKECKNELKNPWKFFDIERGIAIYKERIKIVKQLGFNNLEIHYDAFSGNCIVTNLKTKKYCVFYGKDFDNLIGYNCTKP